MVVPQMMLLPNRVPAHWFADNSLDYRRDDLSAQPRLVTAMSPQAVLVNFVAGTFRAPLE
jgi:hypothetical protein